MSNFRQQLLHEYAAKGITSSVAAFKEKYQPKKESRFSLDDITYEIGPARLQSEYIEFEISSKVPQDELQERSDFDQYFSAIKNVLSNDPKQPEEIGMDLAMQIQEFGPWGQRFPEPLFDGRFEIVEQRVVGGAHLRMKVRALGGREILEAIAFNHQPDDLPPGSSARFLYRLDINRWRGCENCQLMVEKIVTDDA